MQTSYHSLLKSAPAPRLHEDTLPSELELQSLFFSGHFGRSFITTEGHPVHVRQFGEWNHGPGPDFLHCAIEHQGRLLTGPIELDTHPSDWEAHRHSHNPAFDSVILHLSLHPPRKTTFIRTSQHHHIPQVQLDLQQLANLQPAPLHQAPVTLGRCATPLKNLTPTQLEDLLKQAALHRARCKAQLFHRTAEAHSFGQALWQHLALALGYYQNRSPMNLLAQITPLNQLRNLPPAHRTATLFGHAGFLKPDLPETAPADSRQWLTQLWSDWWKLRPHPRLRPLPWTFASLRPANHPHRRVAALAAALDHWPTLEKLAQTNLPALQRHLLTLTDPFWNHHFSLTSKTTPKPHALLGRQRITDFLLNTLHPLKLTHNPDRHWPIYAKNPGPTPSNRVLRAAHRLLGNHPLQPTLLKKAAHQQALLQIYQDFCLHDTSDCKNCPFPEQLQHW